MSATVQLNIPLTISEWATLIRTQLPKEERLKLVSLLQIDDEKEPTTEEIIEHFRQDITALKQGTLKTRPLRELLDEL